MSLHRHAPLTSTLNPVKIRRVLVLDGNPNLRFIYVQALVQAGYETYPVATVQEARDLLSTYDFDVFLTDTHIDNRDQGVNLLREQQQILTKNNIKTVLMSSHSHFQSIGQEIGADRFIEKPMAIDQLVGLVKLLSQERANDASCSQAYEIKQPKQTYITNWLLY